MLAIGSISPNLKAIGEGLAAGKAVFDIIDRKPLI
jgi:hypothetical protein